MLLNDLEQAQIEGQATIQVGGIWFSAERWTTLQQVPHQDIDTCTDMGGQQKYPTG